MKIQTFAVASLLLGSLVSISSAKPVPERSLTMVRNGVLSAKSHNRFYSFRARRGQTITAFVESRTPGYAPLLFLSAPSGLNLTQSKETVYKGIVTQTGLYKVRISTNQMATNVLRGRYHLEVRVR